MEAASIAHAARHDEHHGPPPANRSSRVEPQLLGMLLFIISEVMVFGAFFTAYFFIRIAQGDPWPAPGHAACRSRSPASTRRSSSPRRSRCTGPRQSIKRGNRFGLKAGMLTTFLLGCTFLFIQINEYANIGFAPQDHAQQTIFYSLTGLHGAHVFIGLLLLLFVTIRAFRGHYSPEEHRGVEVPGHLLALRRHHVDRRLHHRLRPLTIVGAARHGVLGQRVQLLNPLRSEAEAFRFLLYALAVIARRDRRHRDRPHDRLAAAEDVPGDDPSMAGVSCDACSRPTRDRRALIGVVDDDRDARRRPRDRRLRRLVLLLRATTPTAAGLTT